jgi:hypothetical protein
MHFVYPNAVYSDLLQFENLYQLGPSLATVFVSHCQSLITAMIVCVTAWPLILVSRSISYSIRESNFEGIAFMYREIFLTYI